MNLGHQVFLDLRPATRVRCSRPLARRHQTFSQGAPIPRLHEQDIFHCGSRRGRAM